MSNVCNCGNELETAFEVENRVCEDCCITDDPDEIAANDEWIRGIEQAYQDKQKPH